MFHDANFSLILFWTFLSWASFSQYRFRFLFLFMAHLNLRTSLFKDKLGLLVANIPLSTTEVSWAAKDWPGQAQQFGSSSDWPCKQKKPIAPLQIVTCLDESCLGNHSISFQCYWPGEFQFTSGDHLKVRMKSWLAVISSKFNIIISPWIQESVVSRYICLFSHPLSILTTT